MKNKNKMEKKDKRYVVHGVLEYAHCFSEDIIAKNKKEVRKKIEKMIDKISDSSMAEVQEMKIDEIEEDLILAREDE